MSHSGHIVICSLQSAKLLYTIENTQNLFPYVEEVFAEERTRMDEINRMRVDKDTDRRESSVDSMRNQSSGKGEK